MLVEDGRSVQLGGDSFPVRRTVKQQLRQVDFVFEQNDIRGLEQNPEKRTHEREWDGSFSEQGGLCKDFFFSVIHLCAIFTRAYQW